MAGKASFIPPVIEDNPDGWGPCAIPTAFKDIPYQPFSKGDRLGKVKPGVFTFSSFQNATSVSCPIKYLFGRQYEIWNFRNICTKISCLPASPRIFEHIKNVIIAHFQRIFTLKRSPRVFGSLLSG